MTILLLVCGFNSICQIHIGIKSGAAINYVHDESEYMLLGEAHTLTDFHVGAFLTYGVGDKFAIAPEILYIQKGYLFRYDPGVNASGGRVNLNYLELPLLVSYRVLKLLSISAGPLVGFNISASSTPSLANVEFKEVCNPFEFGLLGGLQFHITENLSVMTKYSYGLSTIFKKEYDFRHNRKLFFPTFYNNNLQFSVAYLIK